HAPDGRFSARAALQPGLHRNRSVLFARRLRASARDSRRSTDTMRIAALFDNFGPYHLARLNAAGALCDFLRVEFASPSQEYEWQREVGSPKFRCHRLFSNGSSAQCETALLQTELNKLLDSFQAEAVAVPGWSGRLAFAALGWAVRHRIPAIVMSEST